MPFGRSISKRGQAGLTAATGRAIESLESRLYRDSSPWAWNATMIHQDQAVADFPWLTGAGETIVVMDTGADLTNPAYLNKTITFWKDFVGTKTTPVDTVGHGTGVAGIIAGDHFDLNGVQEQGIAPGVNLILLRTDTEKNTTPWATQAQRISNALDWVIANQATYNIVAVNMSTGGNTGFTDPSTPGDPDDAIDQVLRQKFATLAGEGVFLAAAAGNDGTGSTLNQPNTVEYPAADPNVYAASSVNNSGAVSAYASRGVLTDLLAPGENVVMPYGDIAGQPFVDYGTGTSFSAPAMVAAAVLIKQINSGFTPAQIMQILQDSGTAVTDPSTGNTFKLLNIDAALKLAYAELDDLNNHSLGTASPIDVSSGSGQLSGLTLVPNQTDYYSFTLTGSADVTVGVTSSDAAPLTQLRNANGSVISGGLTQTLAAGTYYISVAANAQSIITYSISISATPVVIPPPPVVPGANATVAKIAYDNAGNLYLAFYDSISRTLQFAERNSSGTWSAVTTVDSTPRAGTQLSIAIDPSGHPGIAYYDNGNANLKYAHFNGSTWDISTPDYYQTTGLTPFLTYMSNGQPLIAYYDQFYGQLRLANQVGSAWTIFIVDATGNTGLNASIAYDAAVNTYGIGYEDVKTGHLKYATYYRRVFRTSVIDTSTIGVSDISMAINPLTHNPAMSYFDVGNADLVYTAYTGSRWSVQRIATARSQGQYSNLTFASGVPNIVYYTASYGGINRATPNGSLWSVARITSNGVGLSQATDSNGDDTLSWIDSNGLQFLDV